MNEKLVTLFPEPCNYLRFHLKTRPDMEEWVSIVNNAITKYNDKIKIVEWFDTTDNFVLKLPKLSMHNAADIFESSTKIKCVYLTLSELHLIINEIISIANQENVSRVNWGAGVGLQLIGKRQYFENFNNDLVSVHCIQPGVAAIIRKQYITKHQPPQNQKKTIEWIKVCKILNNKLDGNWITRSIQSLEGVFQRALQHYDRN